MLINLYSHFSILDVRSEFGLLQKNHAEDEQKAFIFLNETVNNEMLNY